MALSQGELNFLASGVVDYIADNDLLVSNGGTIDPIMAYIKSITNVPDQEPLSDEERVVMDTMEYSTGTVDLIGSNGVPSGVDFNEERIILSQDSRKQQYGAKFSIIERNSRKLEKIIQVTGFSASSVYTMDELDKIRITVADQLRTTTYGQEVVSEITEMLNAKIKRQFFDTLDAAESTLYMGVDPILATSGTIANFSNLISGEFTESSLPTGLLLFYKHKTRRGNSLPFIAPYLCFAETSSILNAQNVIKTKYTVNENFNNVLGARVSNEMMILPYETTKQGRTMLLTHMNALVLDADTPFGTPRVVMGENENGDKAIIYSWIFKPKWKGRHGIVGWTGNGQTVAL